MLFPSSKRLVLLNHNEVVIDARYLIQGEVVASGISIDLQVKRVVVGAQILPSPLVKKFSLNIEKIVPKRWISPRAFLWSVLSRMNL